MSNIICHPGLIDYRAIASACTQFGIERVKVDLMSTGMIETVVNVIIRRALSRGWGS